MKVSFNYLSAPVSDLPEDYRFKRVGIIPYFIIKGEPYYFLMLDSKYREWTDCGGTPKIYESWIETAVRETKEESRGIFLFDKKYILENGFVCWREDHRIAIVFCPLQIESLKQASTLCHNYRRDYLKGIERKDQRYLLENSDIDYYTEKRIKEEFKNVYKLVRCLLRAFFRIRRMSYGQPDKHGCRYDKKTRGYDDNAIPAHESVTYP